MRNVSQLKVIAFSLVLFSFAAALAAEVDVANVKVAAQAWIDGGYSLRKLSAKTVIGVERIEIGAENVHVVRLSEGGVMILSADDRIDPVIAFLPSSMDAAVAEHDSPLRTLLARDLAARMAAATNAPAVKMTSAVLSASTASAAMLQTPAQRRWKKLLGKSSGPRLMTAAAPASVSDVRVAPMVASRWGQKKNSMYSDCGDYCFNYYTPGHSPCGCVATAMAQLMRFHRYPATVKPVSRTCRYNGTDSMYEMKGGTYFYDDMPLVPEAEPSVEWYVEGATADQREAIGKLTYDCGVAMQMSWTSSAGSSGGAAAHGPLKEVFGYKNAHTTIYAAGLATAAYREKIIHTNLDAGYPVMLAVRGESGGHEILADGYGRSDNMTYTHLNMGWANADDVWYALPDIGEDFSVVDGIVYNVFPEESGEIVSGRVVDSLGNPISGANVDIRVHNASSALKTMKSNALGNFGFVVPSDQSYVVTARFGEGSASASATTGTSVDSQVELGVGSYSYSLSALTTAVACGNVSCGDLVLSSVIPVDAPVIAPDGGLFYPSETVTLSCATAGATIRYTLDGSDPAETSAAYTAPFTVDDDTVVKARAFKDGFNPSIIVSATFVYDVTKDGHKGDYYASPIRISGASGSYEITDNTNYSLEDGEAKHTLVCTGGSCTYSYQYRTCWYVWTSPGNGTMTFTTRFTRPTALLPSAVAVYPDGVSVPTDTDTRLAMSSDYQSSGDYTTSVSLAVTQGTTYRIVGVPLYDLGGTFSLSWSGELVTMKPKIVGDAGAVVTGDAVNGYTISPSAGTTAVEVEIPSGVSPDKVTVEVSTSVKTVKAHGATIKVVSGGHDITAYLTDLVPDAQGVVDLAAADVKAEVAQETLDPAKGADITLDASSPSITTSATKPGLTYTLYEGTSLGGMGPGASTTGDGLPWSPAITVKGGASSFYSVGVSK